MEKKCSNNEIYFDSWPDYSKVTTYQILTTFFSVIFGVYVDYNRTWQFDSLGMLQSTKNELLQSILLLLVPKTATL